MKRRFLPFALLVLFACQVNDSPVQPDLATDVTPSLAILDGSREGGTPGFLWLPPIVPHATPFDGELDESLLPFLSVEICKWDGAACVGEPFAVFTSESEGPGRLHISSGDHPVYAAKWETHGVDPRGIYRISVKAGPVELGFADVDMIEHGYQAAGIDQDEFVVVGAGRVLPVRFVMAPGALAVATMGPNGGEIETSLGASLVVPAGAFTQEVVVTLQLSPVQPAGDDVVSSSYRVNLTPMGPSGTSAGGLMRTSAPARMASAPLPGELTIRLPIAGDISDENLVMEYASAEERGYVASTQVLNGLAIGRVQYIPGQSSVPTTTQFDLYSRRFEYVACSGLRDLRSLTSGPSNVHVVFVHGWQQGISDCDAWSQDFDPGDQGAELFRHLTQTLGERARHWVYTYTTFDPIDTSARAFATSLEFRFDADDTVIVVGHSMGGLVGRAAAERFGADAVIDHLLTLATPHLGSPIATEGFYALGDASDASRIDRAIWGIANAKLNTPGARDLRPACLEVGQENCSRFFENLGYGAVPMTTFAGRADLPRSASSPPCLHAYLLCVAYNYGGLYFADDGLGPNDGVVPESSAKLDDAVYEQAPGVGYDHTDMKLGRTPGPERDPLLGAVANRIQRLMSNVELDESVETGPLWFRLSTATITRPRLFSSRIDGSDLEPLPGIDFEGVVNFDVSPDGREVLVRASSIIFLATIGDGQRTTLGPAEFGRSGPAPRWSPDGTRISWVNSDGDISVVDRASLGSARLIVAAPCSGNVQQHVWLPDGTGLLIYCRRPSSDSGAWYQHDLTTGVTMPSSLTGRAFWVSFSPDGSQVVFARSVDPWPRWALFRASSTFDGVEIQLTPPQLSPNSPVWTPDGSRIYYIANSPRQIFSTDSQAGGANFEFAPAGLWSGLVWRGPFTYAPEN